ncbi:kinesin [Angomonas deanei]|nr:kinesin [Angomonas deanei]|eukprot:EPY25958.1 kinesin [Angomonas deanei]
MKTQKRKKYVYDNVFGSTASQSDVYEKIGRPMLEEAYKGFNVCLFAYGQTGSGKTHSLIGDIYDEDKKGITPRFIQDLFDEAQRRVDEDPELTIKVSFTMIEVYMEKVHDLLAPRQKGVESESLEIHEDSNRRVYVKGASVHHVLGYERAMQLLKKGNASRQTAETKMNETSSRSHAIMQISMSQEFESIDKKDLECTISLVDLAGSERQSKTESSGQSFEEAKKINHSLLMLGRALNSFSDRKNQDAFISLRESKLTRLLSESFGGNSKTWMLATVSPTLYNITETISTLDYASNALAIKNKARINKSIRDLEFRDLVKLREHLEACLTQENEALAVCNSKVEETNILIAKLKERVQTSNNVQIETELERALDERINITKKLKSVLQAKKGGSMSCFSGVCTFKVSAVGKEYFTLVVPVYDCGGPPPLLVCHTDTVWKDGDATCDVHCSEILHFPSFASGGARVTMWMGKFSDSKVSSSVVRADDGNPQLLCSQRFVVEDVSSPRTFFQEQPFYICVEGFLP